MSTAYSSFLMVSLMLGLSSCKSKNTTAQSNEINLWLTTSDKQILFEKQPNVYWSDKQILTGNSIEVDTSERYQAIDGFGYTLTGGSAYLINKKLSDVERTELLNELFSPHEGIGVSYLRISIGASDLDDQVFSYDDIPNGETDVALSKFSLAQDEINLIPVLKQILAINPEIKIMGSPWSAPAWMKDNNKVKGGRLKPEYYPVYAQYFVKYLKAMADHGIPIDAITIQNEPENPHNTPSMLISAPEQAKFIKDHLGPAFQKAGIATKIVLFDHNCDNPEYPIQILNDPEAKKHVDGTAFHLYLGEISALTKVHDAHPDKNIYFTEQWTSSEGDFGDDLQWHTRNLLIGATRNWSRTVLEWNLAADPENKPHTSDGGCDKCLGAITIGNGFTRNVSYYIIAHAAKFIRPGSVRVASSFNNDLPNVAFVTPEGKTVLILLNDSQAPKQLDIIVSSLSSQVRLPGNSVATLVW